MRQHGIEQLIVGDAGGIESKVVIRGALDRTMSRTETPMRAISDCNIVRLGGHFRYSITCGSMPALRISPSVLRDVPQSRIVIDDNVDHGFAVSRRAGLAGAGEQAATTGAHCSAAPAQQFSVR